MTLILINCKYHHFNSEYSLCCHDCLMYCQYVNEEVGRYVHIFIIAHEIVKQVRTDKRSFKDFLLSEYSTSDVTRHKESGSSIFSGDSDEMMM